MDRWKLRAAAAMALVATAVAWPLSVSADAREYEFRLATPEVKQGDAAMIAVRLVHRPTGRAVPDAVIFASRLDMGPGNMPTMTTPVVLVAGHGGEPGIYRFRANLVMAGGWALTFTAKVQGEEGTVQSRLVFPVVP